MYTNFYQLRKIPFHITPDPEFLFLSTSHKQALASIIYGVEERKGFVAVTGDVGLGKTTLVRSYLERIDREKLKIVYIFNPNISFKNLLKSIYRELGLSFETDDVYELVNQLHEFLIQEYKQGGNVTIIIDDAQRMPVETLENLRMLSNLETSKDKLIQILLIGQPELEKTLSLEELRQLRHRIVIRATIHPLSRKESTAYIRHRLAKVALYNQEIFTRSALRRIVRQAGGNPRTINILCENALITGFGYLMKPINSNVVKEVIADFEGKRQTYALRWGIASLLIFLLMAGTWASPYKDFLLSKVSRLNPSESIGFEFFGKTIASPAKSAVRKPRAPSGTPSFFGKVPPLVPPRPLKAKEDHDKLPLMSQEDAGKACSDERMVNPMEEFFPGMLMEERNQCAPGQSESDTSTLMAAEDLKSLERGEDSLGALAKKESNTGDSAEEKGMNEPPPVVFPANDLPAKEEEASAEELKELAQAENTPNDSFSEQPPKPPEQTEKAEQKTPEPRKQTEKPKSEPATKRKERILQGQARIFLRSSDEKTDYRQVHNSISEEGGSKYLFIGEFPEDRPQNQENESEEGTVPFEKSETFRIITGVMGILPEFEHLSPVRQHVLIDLARELTVPRLSKFTKMLGAIREEDFETASREMLNAKWSKQKRPQVEKLATMMRENTE